MRTPGTTRSMRPAGCAKSRAGPTRAGGFVEALPTDVRGRADGRAHPAALSGRARRGRSSRRGAAGRSAGDAVGPDPRQDQTERDGAGSTRCCRSRRSATPCATSPNQWAALQRFVEDGRVGDRQQPRRESAARHRGRSQELAIRRQLRGRARAALLYSLVQSCTLVDVPPFEYLKGCPAPRRHPSATPASASSRPRAGRPPSVATSPRSPHHA